MPPYTVTEGTLVRGLLVGRDANGEEILYLVTTKGLWAHDIANARFIPTGLQVPDLGKVGTHNATAAVRWRDDSYFASRSDVYKYSVGSGSAVLSNVGPTRDHGLPSGKGYIINTLLASLNDLIAFAHGATGDKFLILAFNGTGWRVLYEHSTTGSLLMIEAGLVSGAYADYRLWWVNNSTPAINYIKLQPDLANPLQISTYTYAAAGTHDWPWFTAGQAEVDKVAVRLKVETVNPTTSETVKVYYAINRSATFQLMTNSTYTTGIITAAGLHTFEFPSVDSWVSTTTRTGTAFRSIQFRVVLARGGTTTNTPDVLSLTLEYYKKLTPKWAHTVEVDITKEYKGNTAKQLRANLLTAIETATLVEYTHRDPNANSNATFYVQVRSATGLEQTGLDERGKTQLNLVEV